MAEIQTPEKVQDLPVAIIKNMITLSASGFGVVVALAWNEVIKTFVANYIDPYLGESSGLISLLIYAVVVTILAIVVTMQLSTFQRRLERLRGSSEDLKEALKKSKNKVSKKNSRS